MYVTLPYHSHTATTRRRPAKIGQFGSVGLVWYHILIFQKWVGDPVSRFWRPVTSQDSAFPSTVGPTFSPSGKPPFGDKRSCRPSPTDDTPAFSLWMFDMSVDGEMYLQEQQPFLEEKKEEEEVEETHCQFPLSYDGDEDDDDDDDLRHLLSRHDRATTSPCRKHNESVDLQRRYHGGPCHTLRVIIPLSFLMGIFLGEWRMSRYLSQSSTDHHPHPLGDVQTATTLETLNAAQARFERQVNECVTNATEECFMWVFRESGLGSQLLNMFATHVYLTQVHNYTTMLVDNTGYGYRLHDGTPFLTGYFTPDMAILNFPDEYPLIDPLLNESVGMKLARFQKVKGKTLRRELFFRDAVEHHDGSIALVSVLMYHNIIVNWLGENHTAMYHTLVDTMCPHLQFNAHAAQQMQTWSRQAYGGSLDLRNTLSVAFHVRRTDKLAKESDAYPVETYVQKAEEVLQSDGVPVQNVEICFLATDDTAVRVLM